MKRAFHLSLVLALVLLGASCSEESDKGCLTGTSKATGERVKIDCITLEQYNCAKELINTGTNSEAYDRVRSSSVCQYGPGPSFNTWGNYTEIKWEGDCKCD